MKAAELRQHSFHIIAGNFVNFPTHPERGGDELRGYFSPHSHLPKAEAEAGALLQSLLIESLEHPFLSGGVVGDPYSTGVVDCGDYSRRRPAY